MKKWFIPLVAVLAIAGALFASPILADDDAQNGRGCGNCPAVNQTTCPRTECPVATNGTAECPRVTDGVCPSNGGCGVQGGCTGPGEGTGCGNANPNCPVLTSAPTGTGVRSGCGSASGGCGMMR
jgi:hypothetical protein